MTAGAMRYKRSRLHSDGCSRRKHVALPTGMTDLLKGGGVSSVDLENYGVAVLETQPR